jgi:hypothetical protein
MQATKARRISHPKLRSTAATDGSIAACITPRCKRGEQWSDPDRSNARHRLGQRGRQMLADAEISQTNRGRRSRLLWLSMVADGGQEDVLRFDVSM